MTSTETPAPAPAKRGRPKKGESAGADMDLSGLTFTVAEMPKRKSATNNPFTTPLGDSYETETARSTTVPDAAVKRVEGMLRRAADELEIGVSVVTSPATDGEGAPMKGHTLVVFQGKDRRKRKSKDETTAETTDATESVNPDAADAPDGEQTEPEGIREGEPAPAA